MNESINYNEIPADLSVPWFKVDNAANLYAGARRKNWCRTYRTTFVFDDEIDKALMQRALSETIRRFPSFQAKLRDGFFWSYFERIDGEPILHDDTQYPYRPIKLEGTDEPCFRVSVFKNRLAMEAFHSISDGGGTLIFLGTLAGRYFELKGETVTKNDFCLDVNDVPLECEVVDDYCRKASLNAKPKNVVQPDVYLLENEVKENYARLTHGLFRVEDVKAAAKKYSLTITEYLTAILIYTFIACAKAPIEKPISISVPINLRKRFDSHSVRNFVYMTDITFEPAGRTDIEFSEICETIKGVLKEKASQEMLLSSISSNVKSQKSPVLRIVPYPFKRMFLKGSYKKSQNSYTAFFSNLGEFQGPEEIKRHLLRVESSQGATPYAPFGCASSSVNGLFDFTFSSSSDEMERQKFFFRFLVRDGVPVRIESNIFE